MPDSFPRQKARTRNFTLGSPRSFAVAGDGSRVVFLRSPAGDDPRTALWVLDVAEGRERLVVDPAELITDLSGEHLSVQERARRERVRETAGGIVAYATDEHARIAVLVQSGRLFVADLLAGAVRELSVPTPVFDPRPDPAGRHVAFVHERALYVVRLSDGAVTRLAGEDAATVSWGMAEFVAAEEMERDRGYWWAPDGETLLVARVDEAPVGELWITDAAHPGTPPRAVRYPAAGSPNASVEAHLIGLDAAGPVPVSWDRLSFPYLGAAHWDAHGPLIAVQSRDQCQLQVLAVDPLSGATSSLGAESDPEWVDLVRGGPRRLSDGRLVTVASAGDTVSLLIDGAPVTPPELEVRALIGAAGEEVLLEAGTDPTEVQVWRWTTTEALTCLTATPGVHTAVSGGPVCVVGSATLEHDGTRWALGDHVFATRAQVPIIRPVVQMLTVGERELRVGAPAAGRSSAGDASSRADGSLRRAPLPARRRRPVLLARVPVAR